MGIPNFLVASAIGLLCAQAALIAVLLIQRARHKDSDTALRRSYARVRDLASRLLTAQEEERARIARDLHDDVCQQLALLKVDITLLTTDLTGRARISADNAAQRLDTVARDIHGLSHRLHPARLHVLGLVSAIGGLQAELTREGVTIRFTHENVPETLPPDLTVALYRIAQEALHNSLKYSGAAEIRIDLRGSKGYLALTIEDNGVGFDVDDDLYEGLGLSSLHERADALGGTTDIRSAVGRGTTVAVRVPVRHNPFASVSQPAPRRKLA